MIILYHTHILITASSCTPCCLIGTGLHLGDCEIVVIVSLFIRLISCWKTPQNVGNSLSELQEIQKFPGSMPPAPSRSSHLRWSTRLSQNPSYSLICCPIYDVLVKPCTYMLVAAVIQTCRLELLQVPR
jgi:hypothetical protein